MVIFNPKTNKAMRKIITFTLALLALTTFANGREGFIVENGATFAVKTPGKVTIDGCVFQGGANVKIEAGMVEIVKSFTAELGSKVEIMQYVE